jgi:pyridoxal phosphate enzyme (YggS family)
MTIWMFQTSSSDVPEGLFPADDERRAELAANLAAVRDRVRAACAAAGRDPADVLVIAVTKTWPASDVRLLRELGMRDFGENRDAEASAKAAACSGLDLIWHFVGQLQTNKCRSVARYASVVHSVDRARLVPALGSAAREADSVVTGLVQVRFDGDSQRGGVAPADVADLARALDSEPGLRLGGVMAVAPLGQPPEPAFAALAECAAVVRSVRPDATLISAGMSGDLEAAIKVGATHVRIGTALLGNRRPRVM